MNFLRRKSCLFMRRYASYSQIKHFLNKLKFSEAIYNQNHSALCHKRQLLFTASRFSKNCRLLHSDSDNLVDIDDTEDITDLLPYDETLHQQSVRSLLYPDSEDPLIINLNKCATVQEVFNFIAENAEEMQHEHITQAVLVLWDLQKLFFYAHQINRTLPDDAVMQDYVLQLTSHSEFHKLLDLITTNVDKFDMESLSCVLLYLNKMGLNVKHDVLELLITRIQESFGTGVSLSTLSRFIITVLSAHNLKSIFVAQDAVPIIIKELEKCESAEDLKLITICLNHLQHIVTNDILQQYMDKVKELIDKSLLTSKNYRTLLKILIFLSYPRWGDKNTVLISEMMLLLKNNLHLLSLLDFFIAYEVLYKHHEPGELLTEMQRCASRMLLHLEDESNLPPETRLKLLSCIVCFSSPLHRPEYERIISKVIKEPVTKYSMFDMLRILTFIKPSDVKLCEAFWDNVLGTMRSQEVFKDADVLLKLCQKYMNYSSDVHYRHKKFEEQMIDWLHNQLEHGIMGLIPSKLSMAAAFIFAYGDNQRMINDIVQKIAENWEQLNHADCLYISKGIRSVAETTSNPLITSRHLGTINQVLDKSISQKLIMIGDTTKVNFLLKSCIYRRHYDKRIINNLLLTFRADQKLSSNAIRNIIFSLQATNGLLPDVVDNIADYVINYRDNLLGFNAEKIAYLCYHLGYLPKRSNELFQAITNVIIRDQERISGLSYIHAALSLSFFNKLPDSFIKQIFNVTFLERLDTELATCYFKDVYPVRVRHSMMQLNRAVCLDYPQSNVPWFHQKYIQQLCNKAKRKASKEVENTSKVKTYLLKLVEDPDYLLEDVYTVYGYHVDFVIHLDKGRLVKPSSANEQGTKIAILLMRSNAYTAINVQLRGQYQLKMRHLEILGYKVLAINLSEWNSMIYGEEKMEYLNKLIWPSGAVNQYSVIER